MEAAFPNVRKRVKGPELGEFMLSIRKSGVRTEDLVFLCIGTDRSTGDSLGPLVGSMLEEAGYAQVFGTLEFPLDASNMIHRLTSLPFMQSSKTFIAIDACLGQSSSIASYQVSNQPMEPGKSVGRMLPPVGNYSIAAIVNHNEGNQYAILQGTSLYRIMTMAKEITAAIAAVFPLESEVGLTPEGELG
ncbi:putative sporulation protein YyaC [Paenibacillus sp. 1_12]|nr:putative sporulation protein YyaC [Paenibacillus sp. 1_12]